MKLQADKYQAKYGPWALVTGASAGIGKAFAHQLAGLGLNLVLVARRLEILEKLASELETAHGIEAKALRADLSVPDSIAIIDAATQDLDVGLVISNAGVGTPGAFLKHDPDREAQLIHLNVTAHMRLSHLFGTKMVERGRGGIVLVSSTGAIQAMPYLANYSGTKAYILNFGESLHIELKEQGVDVTVLIPGPTDTDFVFMDGMKQKEDMNIPMPFMSAEKVAKVALKALGHKQSVTPGGMNKMTNLMSRHLMPRARANVFFGRMAKMIIEPDRL